MYLHVVNNFQKSESHPSGNDEFIHFGDHVLDQKNLVRYLCSEKEDFSLKSSNFYFRQVKEITEVQFIHKIERYVRVHFAKYNIHFKLL